MPSLWQLPYKPAMARPEMRLMSGRSATWTTMDPMPASTSGKPKDSIERSRVASGRPRREAMTGASMARPAAEAARLARKTPCTPIPMRRTKSQARTRFIAMVTSLTPP